MIIHGAEVMRIGGTKVWLRPCETQALGFLAASVVKLDQRGFIHGRYRPQFPLTGVADAPMMALKRQIPLEGIAGVKSDVCGPLTRSD